MKNTRGKLKWTRTDELLLDPENILCTVSPPVLAGTGGTLMNLSSSDRKRAMNAFSQLLY